jgi:hypothetical protein
MLGHIFSFVSINIQLMGQSFFWNKDIPQMRLYKLFANIPMQFWGCTGNIKENSCGQQGTSH